MKILKVGFVCLSLSALLVACDTTQKVKEVNQDGSDRFNGIDRNVDIVTDSETGCKYIYVDRGMGDYRTTAMSPLIKSDGVPDCRK